MVAILQDAHLSKGGEQRAAHRLHHLAIALQLLAQVQQQAATQVADHLAGRAQLVADQRNITSQAAFEQVLHSPQAEINTVQDNGWVVDQFKQQRTAGIHPFEVGRREHQRWQGVWTRLTRDLANPFSQAIRTIRGVGRERQHPKLIAAIVQGDGQG